MKAYNVRHWSLYLDSLIHTWTASSSLQINPRMFPKDIILFFISKFNFITEKLKYINANFSDLPPDLELDLLEQDPSCPTNFFFDIHVIYIVSDILTNFYQDPIIRSTKKSLVTDTCNKSPPPFIKTFNCFSFENHRERRENG